MIEDKEKYILAIDQQATETAKLIFGDIVLSVYSAQAAYEWLDEADTIEQLFSTIKQAKTNNNEIDIDARQIVIEFTNGKKVSFNSSEWGTITEFTALDLVKIV